MVGFDLAQRKLSLLPVLAVTAAQVGACPWCLWEARLGTRLQGFGWPSSLQGWERLSSNFPCLLIKRGHTACSLRSSTCIFFLLEHLTPRGNCRRAISKIRVWEASFEPFSGGSVDRAGQVFLAWLRAGLRGQGVTRLDNQPHSQWDLGPALLPPSLPCGCAALISRHRESHQQWGHHYLLLQRSSWL